MICLQKNIQVAGGLQLCPVDESGNTIQSKCETHKGTITMEQLIERCNSLEESGRGSCTGIDLKTQDPTDLNEGDDKPAIYDDQLVG